MPIPKPDKDEAHEDFMSRCMGNETMKTDYPKTAQRVAICLRQWDDAHPPAKKSMTPAERLELWEAHFEKVAQQERAGTHRYVATMEDACWTNHLGIWAIETFWFEQAVALFKQGHYPQKSYAFYAGRLSTRLLGLRAFDQDQYQGFEEELGAYEGGNERKPYLLQDKVAIIPVEGPLTKARSSLGGGSTLDIQRAVRMAGNDKDVQSLLLQIDSPGGHVAGIAAAANEIQRVAEKKPIHAHIDDLGASAAYWLASQAHSITANATAEVGSIGTMAAVYDESKRFDRLGIQVHVLSTGPYKGLGAQGTEITDKALEYLQARVDDINTHFLAAVQRGRKTLTAAQVKQVADGRVHIAEKAQALGLIDGVASFDDAFEGTRRLKGRLPALAQVDTLLMRFAP